MRHILLSSSFPLLRLSNDAFAKPFSPFDASFLSNIRLCRCIICIYIEFFFFETIKQLRLIYLSLLKRDFSFFLSKNGVQASFRKNSADFLRNSRSLGMAPEFYSDTCFKIISPAH